MDSYQQEKKKKKSFHLYVGGTVLQIGTTNTVYYVTDGMSLRTSIGGPHISLLVEGSITNRYREERDKMFRKIQPGASCHCCDPLC